MESKKQGVCFLGLIEAYQAALDRYPGEYDSIPPREWEGWAVVANEMGVQSDNPAFRARQATKTALAADEANLNAEPVDWETVEKRLEAICTGAATLTQMPTTQEEDLMAEPLRAIILFEEKSRKGRKYYVIFEGQADDHGEWFSYNQLRKDFPAYERMLEEFKQDQEQPPQEQIQQPTATDNNNNDNNVDNNNNNNNPSEAVIIVDDDDEQPAKHTEPPAAPQPQQAQVVAPVNNNTTDSNLVEDLPAPPGSTRPLAGLIPGPRSVPFLQQQQHVHPMYAQDSTLPPSFLMAGIQPPPIAAALPQAPAFRTSSLLGRGMQQKQHQAQQQQQSQPVLSNRPTSVIAQQQQPQQGYSGLGTYGYPQQQQQQTISPQGVVQQAPPPPPPQFVSFGAPRLTSFGNGGAYQVPPASNAYNNGQRWSNGAAGPSALPVPSNVDVQFVHPLIRANMQYAYQQTNNTSPPPAAVPAYDNIIHSQPTVQQRVGSLLDQERVTIALKQQLMLYNQHQQREEEERNAGAEQQVVKKSYPKPPPRTNKPETAGKSPVKSAGKPLVAPKKANPSAPKKSIAKKKSTGASPSKQPSAAKPKTPSSPKRQESSSNEDDEESDRKSGGRQLARQAAREAAVKKMKRSRHKEDDMNFDKRPLTRLKLTLEQAKYAAELEGRALDKASPSKGHGFALPAGVGPPVPGAVIMERMANEEPEKERKKYNKNRDYVAEYGTRPRLPRQCREEQELAVDTLTALAEMMPPEAQEQDEEIEEGRDIQTKKDTAGEEGNAKEQVDGEKSKPATATTGVYNTRRRQQVIAEVEKGEKEGEQDEDHHDDPMDVDEPAAANAASPQKQKQQPENEGDAKGDEKSAATAPTEEHPGDPDEDVIDQEALDETAALEKRLSAEEWKHARIVGARRRDSGVDLQIVWDPDQRAEVVPSARLVGRMHCMETLIAFYESKTKTRGQDKAGRDKGEAAKEQNEGDKKGK